MHSTKSHSTQGSPRSTADGRIALLLAALIPAVFLFVMLTARPAYTQNAVPATARQAARMPQFAPRLRTRAPQPYHLQSPYRNPLRSRADGWLPTDDIVYSNGPINGTTDAWTINFGFIVSDTFTATCEQPNGTCTLTGLTFGAWLFPGDVLQSAEVSITSDPLNGGTRYFDGVVNLSTSGCIGNQYGYNICTEAGSFTVNNLNTGTYWVNLQNASVNTGDPVYWDENSGPSLAEQNSVGTIPSEAFTLLGASTTTCYFDCPPECAHDEPQQNFNVIHNFTADEKSPGAGVSFDQAGRVYGSIGSGGSGGLGLVYQLALHGQDWMFNPLYSFLGGSSGQNPLPGIIGPDGALYGTADGGGNDCGGQPCGEVYRLTPGPTPCLTALCSWSEDVIYRFTAPPDGFQPNGALVFDRAGNLFGTTSQGGAYGLGTIYELTLSNGGWTEKVIYSFTGGSDGAHPQTLLVGQDGNLYGTTLNHIYPGDGVIFQLTPFGNSWTEHTLATYGGCGHLSGSCHPRLLQENRGNLYGLSDYVFQVCNPGCHDYGYTVSQIFMMSPSQNGWQFSVLDDTWNEFCEPRDWCNDPGYAVFHGLTVTPEGQLYATVGSDEGCPFCFGFVFKLLHPYQEQGLAGFGGDDFGIVKVSPNGKLYGVTGRCRNSYGTVWQLTPP